ncbi:lipopolysaccharide biosynthesis protein [Mesobacillus subterraneus]|uniref:lipopolysaccharide biosynthesis protein n=1 Tax=Mesobacillus subterraneus TaxID=285983 RepID=UPI001CFDA565|nr:oligosaccharide flippase family protein [Mesobacillus subterraneus]
MRIQNTMKNIFINISSQIVMIILGFISRKVFIDSLGIEYLGINGLLTNIISMLALIESGIGASIVYSLYKPLAEKNHPKIIALIQLYKKAYTIIAFIILGLSILLFPFLGLLMKGDNSISSITIIYFLFVAKNIVYYLNAHKVVLINADQKGYVLGRINLVFQIITTLGKIVVLIFTENYILYLFIELVLFIFQTVLNGKIVEKRYSYIKTKHKMAIDQKEKSGLIKNIKALFLHNLGGYAVHGTDNMLISAFIGISTVGLYSNYLMIIGQLSSLLTPIISGAGASIGNLIATEKSDKQYSVFQMIFFVNFWLYSVSVICLLNLLEPFLNWWLGEGYLLDRLTFYILLVNFYLTGMRGSILTFKIKGGIFTQDKYFPIIGALVNLLLSILLVKYLGLAGIFLGTTASTLILFWNAPRLVYKHIFKVPVRLYFHKFLFYTIITILTCLITTSIINSLVFGNTFLSLILRGAICFIIPSFVYCIVFYRTKEFHYIRELFNGMFLGIKVKLKSSA